MQPNNAQYNPVQPNTAHYGPVQPHVAQNSSVQPSTAQYIPVKPSTAQHSTVAAQYIPLQPAILFNVAVPVLYPIFPFRNRIVYFVLFLSDPNPFIGYACQSLTNWLTNSCLVNLIDVILACKDANSKLFEVFTK